MAVICCAVSLKIGAVGRTKSHKSRQLGVSLTAAPDILSRFTETSRNLREDDAHGPTSDARARFISEVTPMANVGSAPPGKLKESVQANAAPAPKPVAPTNPAQAVAVAASRP